MSWIQQTRTWTFCSLVCVYSVSLPFLLCVIIEEIIKFNNAYSEKLQSHVQKERDLITLSWKVKELTELDQNGRQLHRDTSSLINKLEEHAEDNILSQLCSFRHKLVSFIKGVSRHQQTPATHILVFMISAEDRRRKPYALPIQCIPYVGLIDAKIRELANKIITEMVKWKMNIAGTDNLILQADSQYLNFSKTYRIHNGWRVELTAGKRKHAATINFPNMC